MTTEIKYILLISICDSLSKEIQLVSKVVIPENIHTGYIAWNEKVIPMYLWIYV